MEKSKRLNTVNGNTLLPEALIQHIQSFLTGKEAARTTLLSISWYNAWLTRSTLDIDQSHFKNCDNYQSPEIGFVLYALKSIKRYQNLNLKIHRFSLRTTNYTQCVELLANKLIVKALEMGATDLNPELSSVELVLPREVLESETLVRLTVSGRKIDDGNVRCLRLKSLSLHKVHMESDMFRDIVSRCILIEELTLSCCRSSLFNYPSGKVFRLPAMNLYEFPKLRRLFLEFVDVANLFSSDFTSRFPCLKDLTVARFSSYKKSMEIASTSLEKVSLICGGHAMDARVRCSKSC